MNERVRRIPVYIGPAVLLVGVGLMVRHGDLMRPHEAALFMAGFVIAAAGYVSSLRRSGYSRPVFWTVAIALRLALLAAPPGDDIYRYLWEGRVLLRHVNPYVHPPSAPELAPLHDAAQAKVVLPGYTAIYPPVAELSLAAFSAAGLGAFGFKAVFAAADLCVSLLLARRFGHTRALLYAWNPLVLYSFAGGGHYDSLFLLPLVAAWLTLERWPGQTGPTALLLGTAIAFKWLALPLAGWLVWQECRRHRYAFACGTAVLTALPLLLGWCAISAWTDEWSLHLWPSDFVRLARSADFLPAVVAAVFPQSEYLNGLFVPPLLLAWALIALRAGTFGAAAEWSLFAAFVLSPMLHAWYFTWLLPFAVLTRNRGTILLTLTGVTYFILNYRAGFPGDTWTLHWWERALVWLPFTTGFLWSTLGAGQVTQTENRERCETHP